MKNEIGFIPKRYKLQPDYYKKVSDAWCAVFIDDEDNEYHLQLNLDPYAWQDDNKYAKSISILKKCKTHRSKENMIEYTSIKSALNALEKIMIKNSKSA